MNQTEKAPYKKPAIKVVFLNDEIIFTSGEECSTYCPTYGECSKKGCSQQGG